MLQNKALQTLRCCSQEARMTHLPLSVQLRKSLKQHQNHYNLMIHSRTIKFKHKISTVPI